MVETIESAPSDDDTSELRIAYFISSYGPPDQLRRLLRTLRKAHPSAELVVHHDVFRSTLEPSVVAEVGGHLLTSPFPIIWSDLSMDRARARVYRWALENLEFDWVVLLSEQDYPIAPLQDLVRRLGESGADAIIDAERVADIDDPQDRADCERRYGYQYVSLPNWRWRRTAPDTTRDTGICQGQREGLRSRVRALAPVVMSRVQRWVYVYRMPPELRIPTRVGVRMGRRGLFSASYPCWKNSSWFALSRSGAQRFLELIDENPRLVRYYERTVIPVESFVSTILCNAEGVSVDLAPLHHVRWTEATTGHPDVFQDSDFEELISSGRFFARKFSAHNVGLLNRLDEHVLSAARSVEEVPTAPDAKGPGPL
jgi:hypothetical protein